MCPPSYFDDNLKTMGSNKDDLIKLHRAWIVEIGELEACLIPA
ncbi:VapE domain-containing protein [Limosilactobacillus fermentum]